MGMEIPKPDGDGDEIRFLIPVGYGKATDKYMRVWYVDGGGKTRPHPRPIAIPKVDVLQIVWASVDLSPIAVIM